MPANVETMFYVREKPWHGLGTEVQEAPTSADALIYAGLDWEVIQKNVYTENGSLISGYKVNLRSTDNEALGIVSDRYKVVQNEDAFQFTDDLLGAGVTYETTGALQGGRKVWMLARMPHRYIIAGDEIAPYLVVMNSYDGSSGIKVAMTPIRVVCQNTLDPSRNNPHVHIIVPTRSVGEDGFSERKDREHDKRKYVTIWREQWATVQNRAYERNSLDKLFLSLHQAGDLKPAQPRNML